MKFRRRVYVVWALVSLLLAGVVVELALRRLCLVCSWTERNFGEYASPYAEPWENGWYHLRVPNEVSSYGQPEFDFELRTNSLGIRDVEHPAHKPEGEIRILGLGDSFTEGQGARYEDGYLKVLERRLNERFDDVTVRVLVGGVAGSDPFYGLKLLEDKLLRYEPDVVTLTINSSDVMDVIARGGDERFLPDRTVRYAEPPPDEWVFARSHLYRAVLMLLGYDWFGLSPSRHVTERSRAVEKLRQVVDEFQELATEEGFRFVVIVHPDSFELASGEYTFDAGELVRHFADRGIHHYDLMGYLAGAADTPEGRAALYWKQDFHHNEHGYRLFAEALEAYLLEHDLLGCGSGGARDP